MPLSFGRPCDSHHAKTMLPVKAISLGTDRALALLPAKRISPVTSLSGEYAMITPSSTSAIAPPPSTWQATFRRVWTALTVALFGAQISTLALPLIAAQTLGATPMQ